MLQFCHWRYFPFIIVLSIAIPSGINLAVANILVLFLLCILFFFWAPKTSTFLRITFISAYLMITTLVTVFFFDIQFSYFQVLRTGIPFLFFLCVVDSIKYFEVDQYTRLLFAKVLAVFGFLSVVFFYLNVPFSNYAISVGSGFSTRLYIIPFTLYTACLVFFLREKNYKYAVICSLILLASGGRTQVIIILIAIVLANEITIKQIANSFLLLVLASALIVFFQPDIFDKMLSFGEDHRVWEINQALNSWTRNYITILFGNGFGTKISEGYYFFSNDVGESQRQYDNSMYDIHNLITFMLARCGLIGTVFLSILLYTDLKYVENRKTLLFFIFLLGLSASSIVNVPDGVLFLFVWCVLMKDNKYNVKQ